MAKTQKSQVVCVSDRFIGILNFGDSIGLTDQEIEQVSASKLAGQRVDLIEALDYARCEITGDFGRCHKVKVVGAWAAQA